MTLSISNTMSTSSSERKCARCAKNSMLYDDSTGEQFCGKCGYVISEKDEQEASSSFPHGMFDNSSRASASSTAMPNAGSSTMIDTRSKDASGNSISTSMKGTIERLKILDGRVQTHSSIDKNLKQAKIEIEKLRDKLTLSDSVIEKTNNIYKKVIERKLTRGYSIKGMIGAGLYVSCRDLGIPRTMDDISDSIDIKKNDILRCYKLIVRELELKIPVPDPKIHVSKIASIVGASEKSKRKAISILQQAEKEGMVMGKEPLGVIAGALYLACVRTNNGKTQKDIADASRVTEKTIRARCKELSKIA